MNYDKKYIDIKYRLINCFLVRAEENLLDISYEIKNNNLTIQVVLLNGIALPEIVKDNVFNSLIDYQIVIKEIFISKDKFNENKGRWQPKYYKWLPTILFSKAEIL